MGKRYASVVLLVLLSTAVVNASAVTLYVKRVLVADPGTLRVSDLVQASGELSQEVRGLLDQGIGEVSGRLLLVPSSLYRGVFEQRLDVNLILVGKRTLVVPRGSTAEGNLALLDRLVEYMESQGGFSDGKVEMELVQVSGLPSTIPASGAQFQPVRIERKAGLYSGAAEYSVRITGQETGLSVGRISLRVKQELSAGAASVQSLGAAYQWEQGSIDSSPAAVPSVQANDPITVTFRKGAIAIEMPGKALGSGSIGETIGVFIPDSKLSFCGVVIGSKAVSIEIP